MSRKTMRNVAYGLVSLLTMTLGVWLFRRNKCPRCKTGIPTWSAKGYYTCPTCHLTSDKKNSFFNLFRKG